MKKILLALVLFGASIIGIANVNAEEINLNDIDTNTYIIGDRIYELNVHYLSIYDIVSATNEYARNHNGEIAPIYYVGETGTQEKYLLEITGSANNDGVIPTEYISDIESVYPGLVIDATAINNNPLEATVVEIEPLIKSAVNTLNTNANNYGFNSVTYENKTVTFNIKDLSRNLVDYKDSGIIALAQNILSNAKKVEYNNKTVDLTVLNEASLLSIAKDILQNLAGVGNELSYVTVANKSTSAKVTFENNVTESVETYTLKFVYDIENSKNADIEEVANKLNENASKYGFESIEYNKDNKTATFTISDADALLVDYKDSGIVALLMANLDGATKVTYTLNGQPKEVDLTVINESKIKSLAKELLGSISNDGKLTLGSVAGESVSADVLYVVGDVEKTITYTITFKYNVEAAKDEEIKTVVNTLDSTAKQYGFKSISYNKDSKMATFSISNPAAELIDYKDSGIVALLMANLDGATKVTYTLNGQPKEVDLTVINESKIKSLAKELLGSISNDGKLTLGSVAGESVSADVLYVVDGAETTIRYTLSFICDVECAKDQTLEDVAGDLNDTANLYGFESVSYDRDSKTATFAIKNPAAYLADYKDSGFVSIFMTNIEGASKLTYTLNGQQREEDLTVINDTKITNIALAILSSLIDEGEELTLGAVAGESVSADVLYVVDGVETNVTYTISFVMSE